MEPATLGWIVAAAVTLAGLLGALYGCRRVLKATQNEAQRQFVWQAALGVGLAMVLLLGAILLASTGVLPIWVSYLVVAAWCILLFPATRRGVMRVLLAWASPLPSAANRGVTSSAPAPARSNA